MDCGVDDLGPSPEGVTEDACDDTLTEAAETAISVVGALTLTEVDAAVEGSADAPPMRAVRIRNANGDILEQSGEELANQV